MVWLILFLASAAGAFFAGRKMIVGMKGFLETFPEGLHSETDALAHRQLATQKSWLGVLMLVLALASFVSLIGVTAAFGGIGLLPMAFAMALINQGARQLKETEEAFEQLKKDYKANS